MPEPAPRRVLPEKHEDRHDRPHEQILRHMEHAPAPPEQRVAQRPAQAPRSNGVEELTWDGSPEEGTALAETEIDWGGEMSLLHSVDQI